MCRYEGQVPLGNALCDSCPLFLVTCLPRYSSEGLALYSECDLYLCEECKEECVLRPDYLKEEM